MESNGLNGETCNAGELVLSASGAEGLYCLTYQQSIGLVVVALSGFVSLTAVLYIFTLIAMNIIYSRRRFAQANARAGTPSTENGSSEAGGEAPVVNDHHRLIEEPMDLFMLSLFLGSFIQALGVVLEVKWIKDGKIRAGSFCSVQGALQNLGQSAIAMQTTVITLHTFATIWWQRGVGRLRTASILVGILWLFLILFIIGSASRHRTPPFYYPTPGRCQIHSHYSDYRIAGESFWLWLAFLVAVLYVPLCFYNVGYISPDDDAKWTFKINSREEARVLRRGNLQTSKLMICAMAYCIPILPAALARWFLLVHNDSKPPASAEAQLSVVAIFATSGAFDVFVFLLARQGHLLFGQPLGPRKPFNIPSLVRIGAWIALNVLDFVFIYNYVLSATDPVPRRKPNETREAWKAYYVMMYVYGFLVGIVNVGVWLRYIRTVWRWFTFGTGGLNPLRIILRYFLRFLIIGLAVIMGLGPFFSPWIGLKFAQGTAWNHRCDSFPVEVVLEGRSYYNSIKENPSVASFYFGQPGRRTGYQYGMTQGDNDIWHLRLNNLTIPPDLDPVYRPVAQELSYRFANNSVAAICNTNSSSNANAIPCMEGSFNGGNGLSLTINDMRTGVVTKLRAFDKGVWAPVPADDAPSVLLREVQPDGSLGSIDVLRTAVTLKNNCTRLKLCMARQGIDLLAAAGLILKAQDSYAKTCTTLNSNF